MNEPIGERQGQVLLAIVREYIRTAEPVGSKHLVGKFNLNVSSATVRNDMAVLEELGYLHQPHTSAGRIPTDSGYRFFVDRQPAGRVGSPGQRELEEALHAGPADLAELLRRASEALSRTTHLAAAALTPRLGSHRLRHLDLAWLGPRTVAVVLIADGGRVEKKMIDVDSDVTEQDVERVGSELNRTLGGKLLPDAELTVRTLPAAKPAALYEGVSEAIADLLAADQDVIVGGRANLAAAAPAMGESLHRVFEAMERPADMQRILGEAEPPASVRIGSELQLEDLQSCSIVVAPYGTGAAIGVIGPTRMEYQRAIAVVSLVARLLDDAVRDLSQ